MPVEIYAPEFLTDLGMEKRATEMVKEFGDCTVIAFYYLLRVGEYTVKKIHTCQRNGWEPEEKISMMRT